MASTKAQRQRELELHRAIGSGDVETTARLLGEGVDPNCVGDSARGFKYAFTALGAAVEAIGRCIEQPKINAKLREAGARLVEFDYVACRINCIEIMKRLLAAGADPSRASFSRTPLSLAAFYGDVEAAAVLLDAGASPAGESFSPYSSLPRPKEGLAFCATALHQAAEKGFADIVRLLVSRGADASALDHEGKTALQYARDRGHTEIVRFLEQHAASNAAGYRLAPGRRRPHGRGDQNN